MADTTPAGGQVKIEADSKNWWTSKTLWLNVVTLVIAIIAVAIDQPWLPQNAVVIATGIVLPVLNMVLRMLTGQPIATPSNPAPK